jgi:hypothetical protein
MSLKLGTAPIVVAAKASWLWWPRPGNFCKREIRHARIGTRKTNGGLRVERKDGAAVDVWLVAEAALIIRVSKKNRYSIISNVPINDKRLSWESSGLHTWLMSKPDTWEVNRAAIVKVRKAGRDKVTRMLAELGNCGYLTREKHRGQDGRFHWVSVLYEEPNHENHGGKTVDGFSALDTGKPSTAEPSLDKPATGKAPLLNTDRAIPDSGKTESCTHTSDLASPS